MQRRAAPHRTAHCPSLPTCGRWRGAASRGHTPPQSPRRPPARGERCAPPGTPAARQAGGGGGHAVGSAAGSAIRNRLAASGRRQAIALLLPRALLHPPAAPHLNFLALHGAVAVGDDGCGEAQALQPPHHRLHALAKPKVLQARGGEAVLQPVRRRRVRVPLLPHGLEPQLCPPRLHLHLRRCSRGRGAARVRAAPCSTRGLQPQRFVKMSRLVYSPLPGAGGRKT